MTDRDRADLAAIAGDVDLVAQSSLRRPQDVRLLRQALRALGQPDRAMVLKIENRQAFAHLPAILLQALRHERVGEMIARGDLAVEGGSSGWPRCRRKSFGCTKPRTCR